MCTCDFGSGLTICHCAQCHESWTSLEAFDSHQEFSPQLGVRCRDPRTVTLPSGRLMFAQLRTTPDGRPVWGRYRPDLPQWQGPR